MSKKQPESPGTLVTLHEVQAARIKAWCCPQCGAEVKDKGNYVHWDTENGWCMERLPK